MAWWWRCPRRKRARGGVGGRGGYPGVRGGVEESKMPSGVVRVLRGSVHSLPEEMLRRAPAEGGRLVLGHQANTGKDQEVVQDKKDANMRREGTRG